MIRRAAYTECFVTRRHCLEPGGHEEPVNRLALIVPVMGSRGAHLVMFCQDGFAHPQCFEELYRSTRADVFIGINADNELIAFFNPVRTFYV